ncbi:MAG: Protein ImuA [Mucilaginibacter sp.]|nr:Protein ImuA [Mucilaginibacter sp.]
METNKELISQLKKDILAWEGFKPPASGDAVSFGLGIIEASFPNGVFPIGAVHEFINAEPEHAAATEGFISGLLGRLMESGGACVWVSRSRMLFPSALKAFGVIPEQVIFIDLQRDKDVLWVTEEALKCGGLAAVIAELPEISFTQTRRLQLAVESSKVTGFILRSDPRKLTATACVARWRITPLPSETEDGLPGVGFPRWEVELLKVRNGNTGNFKLEWAAGKFVPVVEKEILELYKYA